MNPTPTTALAAVPPIEDGTLATAPPSGFVVLRTLNEAIEAANYFAKSLLVPEIYRGKPADIVVAWQYGQEVGLSPMAALRSVAVINGKPGLYGDGLLGVVMKSPLYVKHKEWFDSGTQTAHFQIWRRGIEEPFVATFSHADADAAGLLSKDTYKKYERRMLQWRARGWGLRDGFADILAGMQSAEELMDYETVETSAGKVEVAMPRRRSEVVQGEVVPADDAGAAAVEEAAKAVAAVTVPPPAAPAAEPEKEQAKAPAAALTGDTYIGIIADVFSAWKGRVDGKDAELFVIKTVDGQSCSTYLHDGFVELARELKGSLARFQTLPPNAKGHRRLVKMEGVRES